MEAYFVEKLYFLLTVVKLQSWWQGTFRFKPPDSGHVPVPSIVTI